jgi:hypothetical protein
MHGISVNREAPCEELRELCQWTYTSCSSRTDIPGLQNGHVGDSIGNKLSRCKDTSNSRADDYDGSTGGQIGRCAVVYERIGVSSVPE